MKTIELTDKTFDGVLNNNISTILVDFGAAWCPPCLAMEPVLEDLAEELDGRVVIGKVDVDESPEIAARYGVRNLPTFIIFKNGILLSALLVRNPGHYCGKSLIS